MPYTKQQDSKLTADSTRARPPAKTATSKPDAKKVVFTDWASI